MEASAKDSPPQPAVDYRGSVETVGAAFLVLATLEIAWMVYGAIRDHALTVGAECFLHAVAGVLLVAGSLRTARVVALAAAFSLSASAASALAVAPHAPWGLIWLYLKLYPAACARTALLWVVWLALVLWAYRRLTAPRVLAAMPEPRPGWPRLRRRLAIAAILGAAAGLAIWPFMVWLQTGTAAERAKSQARAQVGPGYRFYVTRVASSSLGNPLDGDAVVIAYRDNEIRRLHVTWQRERQRAGHLGLPVALR